MGPARTVNRPIVENHFSRSSLDARDCAPEAEFYAKLSKLPKLYMVTPRDRQDNGLRNAASDGGNSACAMPPRHSGRKLFRTNPVRTRIIKEWRRKFASNISDRQNEIRVPHDEGKTMRFGRSIGEI